MKISLIMVIIFCFNESNISVGTYQNIGPRVARSVLGLIIYRNECKTPKFVAVNTVIIMFYQC